MPLAGRVGSACGGEGWESATTRRRRRRGNKLKPYTHAQLGQKRRERRGAAHQGGSALAEGMRAATSVMNTMARQSLAVGPGWRVVVISGTLEVRRWLSPGRGEAVSLALQPTAEARRGRGRGVCPPSRQPVRVRTAVWPLAHAA